MGLKPHVCGSGGSAFIPQTAESPANPCIFWFLSDKLRNLREIQAVQIRINPCNVQCSQPQKNIGGSVHAGCVTCGVSVKNAVFSHVPRDSVHVESFVQFFPVVAAQTSFVFQNIF